jgi:hypothetical protein
MEQQKMRTSEQDDSGSGFLRSRTGLVLLAFVAIAAFFLWTEHRAHVLGVLPWLLVAACPLMHLFMHRGGHGGHHGREQDGDGR